MARARPASISEARFSGAIDGQSLPSAAPSPKSLVKSHFLTSVISFSLGAAMAWCWCECLRARGPHPIIWEQGVVGNGKSEWSPAHFAPIHAHREICEVTRSHGVAALVYQRRKNFSGTSARYPFTISHAQIAGGKPLPHVHHRFLCLCRSCEVQRRPQMASIREKKTLNTFQPSIAIICVRSAFIWAISGLPGPLPGHP